MPKYLVPAAVLPAFSFALKTIKDGVPSRFIKIAAYMKEFVEKNPAILDSTRIEIGRGRMVACNLFDPAQLRLIHAMIHQSPSKEIFLQVPDFMDGFTDDSDIQPVVLVTSEKICDDCSADLVTENRPTFVTLYTVRGKCTATSFHKRCAVCKTRHHVTYKVSKDGGTVFTQNSISQDYMLTSSKTGFEILYLRTIADLIETAALSFTGAAESYTTTHGVHMERQRLEDAYFLFRLISMSKNDTVRVTHADTSNRLDLETACYDALECISFGDNPFIGHACDVKGCKEGFVMADGIEKIHRRTCAAPTSAIRLTKSMPKLIMSCPESPSFSKNSRYCNGHQDLEDEGQPAKKKGRIVITIDTIDMRCSSKVLPLIGDDLPSNEDTSVHIGCKLASNVNRFYKRTAGIMAIVRPCGIIIDYAEMLTCESPSQLFVQLLRLKCDSGAYLKYMGYDRACEFEPFLKNLQKKDNLGATMLLDDMTFLVDKFHIKGHTTPKCDIADPACLYHPDLPRFSDISGVNTECAEQAFAWLGKFKHMMKYMSQNRFKFFLFLIIRARNLKIESRNC